MQIRAAILDQSECPKGMSGFLTRIKSETS